jgi:hypothetical protein
MHRLAGARVFALTVTHRARMRVWYVLVPAHMRAHPDSIKRPSIFGYFVYFLTLLQCCEINPVP